VGAVALTAGSQAWVIGRALGNGGLWPEGVPLVVIGPATEAVALGVGLPQPLVADPHTLEGVVEVLVRLSRGAPGAP
jgi:uroporphyrinogen-III synthase